MYLYKDPAQPLSVTGSFDSISGTYAFQGRGFDVLESSSINFRGDLNPEIYVTVTRVISGVETRVSIFGPLKQPELRLASTPPLDQSDILSLIVFNAPTNLLSAAQQQQLLVRAGTLAAGFLVAPILSAIENETGIDIIEVEPDEFGTGAKITIGGRDRARPGRAVQPAVRPGGVRRGDHRVLPVASLPDPRHLLRRAGAGVAIVPPRRARRHRPAHVL